MVAPAITRYLDRLPFEGQLNLLFHMLDDIVAGRDASLEALQIEASAIGVRTVVVGGVAVIRHGYRRTTTDRDVLIDFRDAPRLADRLMESSDWERLEIRQYAFLHKPTNMVVDFLVSGDLVQLGRPYLFPFIDKIETVEPVGGIPVIGLHDLLWLKLLAGRMRDLGDMMELCKLHLGNIEPDRVLASLEPEDDDLRQTMLEIIRKAPIEIANERRLGQGLHPDYKKKPS